MGTGTIQYPTHTLPIAIPSRYSQTIPKLKRVQYTRVPVFRCHIECSLFCALQRRRFATISILRIAVCVPCELREAQLSRLPLKNTLLQAGLNLSHNGSVLLLFGSNFRSNWTERTRSGLRCGIASLSSVY